MPCSLGTLPLLGLSWGSRVDLHREFFVTLNDKGCNLNLKKIPGRGVSEPSTKGT